MANKIYEWIKKEESRKEILAAFRQPLTAKQLAKITSIPADTCSYIIARLTVADMITCLNPQAKSSRLYWLTETGCQCQQELNQDLNLQYKEYNLPDVNWETYGWICFSHRSIVLKAITELMQPSAIRRAIRKRFPKALISANNVRDIIKLFLDKGLIRKVYVRKKAHPRYELADSGSAFQKLLIQSETNIKL